MPIEKGPTGEKTHEELLLEFKKDFEDWLKMNPEIAQELKQELLEMAGIEENELVDKEMGFDLGVIKIPVEQLSIFGTSCGDVGNKAFSQEVIDFLKSKKAEFIIGLSDNKEPKISSAAMQINEKDGEKLEKLIDKNKGSLRAEASRVEGWSVFESE